MCPLGAAHIPRLSQLHFNVSLTSTPGCSKWSFSPGSSKPLNEFFIALKLDPRQTRIILLFLPPCHFQTFLSTLSLFFHVSRLPGEPELPHYRGFTITLFNTAHFVGLLWTSDQPGAETSDNTQHSQHTDIHATGGIRTRISGTRAAADPRIRPRDH